jgi:hypothetical protein
VHKLKVDGDLPTKEQTVAQWFTYWLKQVAAKEVRPNTLAGYKSVVFGHIIPPSGRSGSRRSAETTSDALRHAS